MINKEEIMQLGAGRDIDILVAERVMNWQLETDGPKLSKLNGYFSLDEGRRWWRNPDGGWHCDPPAYSSDIAAAWQVVEKMSGRGQTLFLSQALAGNQVAFDKPSATHPDFITESSVARGICKAALIGCL